MSCIILIGSHTQAINYCKLAHLRYFLAALVMAAAAACSSLPSTSPSDAHLKVRPTEQTALTPPSLKPVRLTAYPAAPIPRAAQEVFSVVVNDVSVKTLLFALARDNRLNVDIHPSVGGRVTLNASDQTLPQLLERIAAQTDIRYEITGNLLRVLPDNPYLSQYTVDYVNLQRNTTYRVTAGSAGGSGTGAAGAIAGNATISSSSDNRFWDSLVSNLCQIVVSANQYRAQRDLENEKLRTTERDERLKVALELTSALQQTTKPSNDRQQGADVVSLMREVMGTQKDDRSATNSPQSANTNGTTGATNATTSANTNNNSANASSASSNCGSSSGGAASSGGGAGGSNPLMVNRESGVMGIFTTSKGHEQARAFLDRIMAGARRQVLIEATVVEVQLSANAQSGINWSQVATTGRARGLRIGVGPSGTGVASLPGNATASILTLGYDTRNLGFNSEVNATISLLESFGQTKVLSSPKLTVINNQTALIKVVEDHVYVTIQYTAGQRTVSSTGLIVQTSPDTYTSVINTVPLGFVMTVTPQISESDEVTLNVRPSITRLIREITDPNPALLNATTPIVNKLPVIQARELESILRVPSGEIAVLGGLMQESGASGSDGIPGTSSSNLPGGLLGQRIESKTKTELVVFLRPVVIKDASVNGDYKEFRSQLPTSSFFDSKAHEAWKTKP